MADPVKDKYGELQTMDIKKPGDAPETVEERPGYVSEERDPVTKPGPPKPTAEVKDPITGKGSEGIINASKFDQGEHSADTREVNADTDTVEGR